MNHPGIFGAHPDRRSGRTDPAPDALFSSQPATRRPPAIASTLGVGWTLEELDQRFRSFIDECEHVEGQSRYTLLSYRVGYSNFRKFLIARVGIGRSLGLALFAIDEWTAATRRSGTKPITINTYWRRVRSFFTYLERRHAISSPFTGLRQPAVPTRIPKALPPADCRRILDAAANYPWQNAFDRTRAVAMMAIALFAGLRRTEILKLQFLDVDLQVGTVRVNAGKGRGGGKDRIVPIAPELRSVLTAYLRERRLRGITAPEFFCSLRRGRGVALATLRRITSKVQRASGVRFTLHVLRHSFVTQLLRSGVALHTAGALAGHSQITTTAGYLRVFDEDKEDAMRVLRY